MSLEIDYLPVATAAGANVDAQANFAGSTYQTDGFTNGPALPYQFNKILRQSSMMSAALANIISATLGIAVLDDGNLAELITNLTGALGALSSHTVAALPSPALYSLGTMAFATNGRNTGEAAGAGTGCPVFVKSVSGTNTWCAAWSGVAVTA